MSFKARRCIDGGGTHSWRRVSPLSKRCGWCGAEAVAPHREVKQRRPIAPVSTKRRAITGERSSWRAELLGTRQFCELPALLAAYRQSLDPTDASARALLSKVAWQCQTLACDVHEIVGRGVGGKIVPSQGVTGDDVLCLCRRCHTWVTDNPAWAERVGARRRGWERPEAQNPKTDLGGDRSAAPAGAADPEQPLPTTRQNPAPRQSGGGPKSNQEVAQP